MLSRLRCLVGRIVRRYFRPRPPGSRVEKIGASVLYWNAEHLIYIRDYYLYSVGLLRQALEHSDARVNLILGGYDVGFLNTRKTCRVDIQYEHTLVRPGGRCAENAREGQVLATDGVPYLVRIPRFEHYRSMDHVIEYSLPNLENIRRAGGYEAYLRKCVYIAPLLYPVDRSVLDGSRSKDVITTFTNESEPRRKAFLDRVRAAGVAISNETNRFDHDSIGALYRDSRILVNIRQTQHHHTFEELRVLPALLCGCLVISEDVPLREAVPYGQHVIWADPDSIVDVIREVQANYQEYRDRVFTDDFFATMQRMSEQNEQVAREIVAGIDA